MKNFFSPVHFIVLAFMLLQAAGSQASVVIGATRVVYSEAEREVTIRLTNEGEVPALVEAWVDNGDATISPDKVTTPFTLSPPVFRMEPHKGQTLRMIYSHEPLPQDRESIFWLNVLEVPPMPKKVEGEEKNMLQFAFRSRLKIFFRPKGLTVNVQKAPEQLTWKTTKDPSAKECSLEVKNPTPFHITFNAIDVKNGTNTIKLDGGMVAPMDKLRLPMSGTATCPTGSSDVTYTIINDYGGTATYRGASL